MSLLRGFLRGVWAIWGGPDPTPPMEEPPAFTVELATPETGGPGLPRETTDWFRERLEARALKERAGENGNSGDGSVAP